VEVSYAEQPILEKFTSLEVRCKKIHQMALYEGRGIEEREEKNLKLNGEWDAY
jgi:hypothetical protein